jgi:hypothetical protein
VVHLSLSPEQGRPERIWTQVKNFLGPPSQGGRAKNLYSKSESWLSVAEGLGLGLKRLIVNRQTNDTTEEDTYTT